MNYIFLKYVSALVTLSLLIIACKKSGDNPEVNLLNLKVLEFKTNIPIADAEVVLYKCIDPDPYGCLGNSVVGTLLTDKDGNFQFDAKKLDVYLIRASHSGYWNGHSGGDFTGFGYVYLTPVAHTKIHLKKINAHPPELLLHIVLDRYPAPIYPLSFGLQSTYNLVNDSTVVMDSYGNNNNNIIWIFTDKSGTVVTTETGGEVPSYYINRFDTATAEINY